MSSLSYEILKKELDVINQRPVEKDNVVYKRRWEKKSNQDNIDDRQDPFINEEALMATFRSIHFEGYGEYR